MVISWLPYWRVIPRLEPFRCYPSLAVRLGFFVKAAMKQWIANFYQHIVDSISSLVFLLADA